MIWLERQAVGTPRDTRITSRMLSLDWWGKNTHDGSIRQTYMEQRRMTMNPEIERGIFRLRCLFHRSGGKIHPARDDVHCSGYTRFLSPNGGHGGSPTREACSARQRSTSHTTMYPAQVKTRSGFKRRVGNPLPRQSRSCTPRSRRTNQPSTRGAGCGQYGTTGLGGFRYKRVAMIQWLNI